MSDTGTGTEAEALPREAPPLDDRPRDALPQKALPRTEAVPPLLPGPGQPPGSGPGGTTAVDTAPGPADSGEAPGLGSFLARAAAGTAALTVLAAVLGLVRDQAIARYFGASDASDAFLIAWTVPEMAATLLIEDGMALLLVPAFSLALTRRADAGSAPRTDTGEPGPDPVRELVAATLPRLCVLLMAGAALLMAGAPWVVRVLAPGLADPDLAVDCTRLTAVTVLTFGITGYFSAALRAHRSFLPPAGVYVAYNIGIIGMTLALHSVWGVRAAAAGVAVGSLLMILTQLPTLLRLLPLARPRLGRLRKRAARTAPLLGVAVLAPVVLFVVSRQSQVLVERFLASTLPAGAISHLNYAQKVAQMPMVLSLMICTVTFPVVARAMADGNHEKARQRVERDLALAGMVVLLGTAVVLGYAPQIIEVLFQRGAFDTADTEATAQVMRVYAAGLLGHCLVGALSRPFFSSGRPTWFPAFAMGTGLVVTMGAGYALTYRFGVAGIATANAVGISTTALLLLMGLGTRVVPIRARAVALSLGRLAGAALVAGAAGWAAAQLVPDAVLSLAAGCVLVPAVFFLTGLALRSPEVVSLLALIRRRFTDGR
ncbi:MULTISPECIES: murein biosynthesis integral membrane protein MurJ [Streptomyces]|uniref:murein biosynthesis integral membrane protein MurJ n=1 Tax=Streptomyces TaxID=1883 RepID=UPI000978F4DF|nr:MULTISPECIES: lipid II flippase MurJ [unclassified Streptomyces]NDZ64404.1 virulence factor MviN [Streptomyces cyaneofuscatus]ONI50165.1 putative lipid II flippase MurJ [Streptomyces sp. IB2014 011-1]RDV48704.1 virulence factor MviN [Streptomyces sp. IB2014 011-12]